MHSAQFLDIYVWLVFKTFQNKFWKQKMQVAIVVKVRLLFCPRFTFANLFPTQQGFFAIRMFFVISM